MSATVGSQQPLRWWLFGLAVTGGSTDITSFIRLGTVFSSVMTGNLTLLGLAAAQGSASIASHIGVAVGGYIIGASLGSIAAPPTSPDATPRLGPAVGALLLELVCFVAFTIGWELTHAQPRGAAQYGLLVSTTVAMGLQAAVARHLGSTSTTYLTGVLTSAVASLATGGAWRQNRANLGVLLGHAVGAVAAGGLIFELPRIVPLLPLTALISTILALYLRRGSF